jgi:hypothetical protein
MNVSKPDPAPKPPEDKAIPSKDAAEAHVALVEKLSQIFRAPGQPKPARSLQPTPEAAKTRLARLRRKQRMLIHKSKHGARDRSTSIPPAPDPLAP